GLYEEMYRHGYHFEGLALSVSGTGLSKNRLALSGEVYRHDNHFEGLVFYHPKARSQFAHVFPLSSPIIPFPLPKSIPVTRKGTLNFAL
ncbi:hypothetical protein A2U01_0020116, partial [Trifolium medium]|nr:hypothetical protein [Trifolium medium]